MLDPEGELAARGDVDVSLLKSDGGDSVAASPTGSRVFYAMNVAEGPLADSDIRRAIVLAVDTELLVERFFPGATPMRGLLSWTNDGCGEVCSFDADAARALVVNSELGEQPINVDFFEVDGDDFEQRVAEAIASQLRDVGLIATARAHSVDDYGTRISNGELELFRFGSISTIATGAGDLQASFHSEGGDNVTSFADESLDQLLNEAVAEPAPGLRRAIYQEAEQVLFSAIPILPLAQLHTHVVLSESLAEVGFELDGSLDLDAFVWVE